MRRTNRDGIRIKQQMVPNIIAKMLWPFPTLQCLPHHHLLLFSFLGWAIGPTIDYTLMQSWFWASTNVKHFYQTQFTINSPSNLLVSTTSSTPVFFLGLGQRFNYQFYTDVVLVLAYTNLKYFYQTQIPIFLLQYMAHFNPSSEIFLSNPNPNFLVTIHGPLQSKLTDQWPGYYGSKLKFSTIISFDGPHKLLIAIRIRIKKNPSPRAAQPPPNYAER